MLKQNEKLNIKLVSDALKPVFDKYNVKKAVLFGSVAKNKNDVYSDVDVMVDSGLKGIAFYGLFEAVVEILNKKVDLIDLSQIEPGSRIEQEIINTGVQIYG